MADTVTHISSPAVVSTVRERVAELNARRRRSLQRRCGRRAAATTS